MTSTSELKILSGRSNIPLAEKICQFLHLPLGGIALSDFPDGEIGCKIEDDVRGRDVFLIQPTCPPVNKNIMELLIMIDSCKRASAGR
ncbi:ribose-phosphate pyrophosphokinase-like domain-containing protein, partial [Moorena producens]